MPDALARLRIGPDDAGGYLAIADNLLAGPIEVRLHGGSEAGVVGDPALPARAAVPALGSVVVARLHASDAARGGRFSALTLDTVPGSSNARPLDVEYAFPLPSIAAQLEQGWGGRESHDDDENHYAVDFAAADGTPVVAARDGVVMQVEARYAQGTFNPTRTADLDTQRANFIRILHDDGSMAVYAHLAQQGVRVQLGERVQRGQTIGLSGNTGRSSGPHLHFGVQVDRGLRLVSIPFRMFAPSGILRFGETAVGGAPVPH